MLNKILKKSLKKSALKIGIGIGFLPILGFVYMPAAYAQTQIEPNLAKLSMMPPMPMPPMPMPKPKIYSKKVANILSVNGVGKQSVNTPVANIQLAIEVLADSALNAQKEMSKRSDAVINYLKQQKVQDLRTQSLSLDARYEYIDNKQKLTGYQANYTIRFQVPQQQAGLYLDESIRLGASRIDHIQFAALAADVDAAQEKALVAALEDANNKAELTFKTLGVKKIAIKKIQLHDAGGPIVAQQFDAMPMMVKAARSSAPTPIVGGTEMVEARVSLEIEYE